VLIEQAEALGEPPEDPLLLFSVLYGGWVANLFALNGDAVRELAAQFMTFAEKQGAAVPLMIGHRKRLIKAAKQNRSGHRDATAILVAYRHGLRASEVVALRGRCGSSYTKHQRHPTSSSRNDAHLCPQPDISAWWPGRAWPRNSAFS
jgi:hypothetical protein